MTLAEAVDGIFSKRESEAKELERREREKEEIEKKRKEYYEAYMKEETERLNTLVDLYKFKLDEIRETPVDRDQENWKNYTDIVRRINTSE